MVEGFLHHIPAIIKRNEEKKHQDALEIKPDAISRQVQQAHFIHLNELQINHIGSERINHHELRTGKIFVLHFQQSSSQVLAKEGLSIVEAIIFMV
jgi:hypothetical protein